MRQGVRSAAAQRALVALVTLLVGCTASKAQIQIISAEQALRRAEEYEADTLALYEYQMAAQYLAKAKEEAGWSDFRIADALARQSAEWSDRAIIFVERHGRAQFNLEGLSDTEKPMTSPGPAPAPAPEPEPGEIDPWDEEEEP
jgi:hypothetical protein